VPLASQILRFGLHLAVIYLIPYLCSLWLAGRFQDWIIPLLEPGYRENAFSLLFSYLFAFTFTPALMVGLLNGRYKQKIALFACMVPAIVLSYKFVTFPATVFENHFQAAFHHYFAREFLIGNIQNHDQLFALFGNNPDMVRGLDQLKVTGPFYSGLGYSFGTFIALRIPVDKAFSRFERRRKLP
jgi:hypothetical protein